MLILLSSNFKTIGLVSSEKNNKSKLRLKILKTYMFTGTTLKTTLIS